MVEQQLLDLPPEGDENDLIEHVLASVHGGSGYTQPFLSCCATEAAARHVLSRAKRGGKRFPPDPEASLRRLDLSRLHPGQVIYFDIPKNQGRLIQGRSSVDRFAWFFTGLLPNEVQPSAQAQTDREVLLVARGAIPRGLFEELPLPLEASRTSRSVGAPRRRTTVLQ